MTVFSPPGEGLFARRLSELANRDLVLDGVVTGTFYLQHQTPWRLTDGLDEHPVAPDEGDLIVGGVRRRQRPRCHPSPEAVPASRLAEEVGACPASKEAEPGLRRRPRTADRSRQRRHSPSE